MKVCTFIGHRDSTEEIRALIKHTIIEAIEKENITNFYVGHNGSFDKMVYSIFEEICTQYENIDYSVILAYLPIKPETICKYKHTIYPEGTETVPKKFAISFRNRWMIKNSDMVIAYVKHSFGGAAQFFEYAKKQKKKVINIAENKSSSTVLY